MAQKAKETQKSVAQVLQEISKSGLKVGFEIPDQKFLTTSNIAIDWACGGGLPVGKVVEIYGKTGSGKTTLALQAAVACQQSGGTIVWADYERAFDWEYAEQLGLDREAESFIYLKPRSIEQGGDAIAALVNTGEVDLVVIDSTARMTSESELDGSMSDLTVADKAKALYKFCRKILNALDDNQCTLVFLNHLLEQINTRMPGTVAKITPGGNAVPYFASLRLEAVLVKSNNSKTEDAKYDSVDIRFTVTKNRAAPPSRQVTVRNDFGTGFNNIRSALDVVESLGIVSVGKTGWTEINDEQLRKTLGEDKYHGFDNFVLAVAQNDEARAQLISSARQALNG